jgi:hypothetical protein
MADITAAALLRPVTRVERVPSVVVVGLTHGSPRIEYVGSLMRLQDYERSKPAHLCHWNSLHFKTGPYISRNRNYLTRLFLERTSGDWLLMMDHDVVVPETLIEDLLAEARVSGHDPGVIIADHLLGTSCGSTAFLNDPDDPTRFCIAARPDEGRSQLVETIASSVVMTHRRVFETIAQQFGRGTWWMMERIQDKEGYWDELGEDFSFSRRVMAVGERMLAVYGLEIQHFKVGMVTAPPKIGGQ